METRTIRVNISVPKDLLAAVDRMAGKRKRSRFIAEAVRERVEQAQREKLAKLMARGYRENREDSADLSEEFEAVDLENWDEY